MNELDFDLSQIVECKSKLNVIECENGNHWTFINENLGKIYENIFNLLSKPAQAITSSIEYKSKL